MRIIALAKDRSRIANPLLVLKSKGHHCIFGLSLDEVLTAIVNNECDVLLVSVDFPDARVEKFIQMIEQKFELTVLVFTEDFDSSETSRLRNLKAKNIFYSYPTGLRILDRLQQIGNPMKTSGDTHIVKGEKTKGFLLEPQLKKISEASRRTLDFICPSRSREIAEMGPLTECEFLSVDSFTLRGTFIVACSVSKSFGGSPLQAIQEYLFHALAEAGSSVSAKDVRILPMHDFEVPAYLLASAEFSTAQRCRQFDATIAYFSSTSIMPAFLPGVQPLRAVDLGRFIPHSKINVDVFVPLSKAGRSVLYWRKNTMLRPEQINRMATKGVEQMNIRQEDLGDFERYCTLQTLISEVAKLKAS